MIMMKFTSQKLKSLAYCVGIGFIPGRMFWISVSLRVSKSLLMWPERFFPPSGLLLLLGTKNSIMCYILWGHRYLEVFNFDNEKEREGSRGEGQKTGLGGKGREGGRE